MTIARQLYQLQEIELEIESTEQAQARVASQLGKSQAIKKARAELKLAQQNLEELKRQQNSAEWEIENLVSKLTSADERLYSGQIHNPKELADLQHEVEWLKIKRDQLEDKALEIMGEVELSTTRVATLGSQLKELETEWRQQQHQLSTEMEQLKNTAADLENKRHLLLARIDTQTIEFYNQLKGQKRQAVAKVEQGVCCGCWISLPTTEIQRARGNNLVQCSSCGRILFLA